MAGFTITTKEDASSRHASARGLTRDVGWSVFGLASSACCRSAGMVAVLAEAYAASQRPSWRARSTSARPRARILPEAMNACAFALLISDQMLLAVRGVKRCSQWCSLSARFWTSIQPWHSALSSACA